MLPRVLEPEVMDSAEEAQDYDAMDHSEVNRVFVQDFLQVWPGASPVLDVGTGTAQIPIELCLRHPVVEVTAIDLASHMLELARRNVERAGLARRLHVREADAKALPYADHAFAALISNSIVHHIPEPVCVLREMIRVVAPGGTLLVRDLLRPGSEAELARLVASHAGSANPHQRQMFADSLHAALTLEEIRQLVASLGYPADGVRQTTDRHWTWIASRAPIDLS